MKSVQTNFADLAGRQAPAIISLQSGCFQLSAIIMVGLQAAMNDLGFSFRALLLLYMVGTATCAQQRGIWLTCRLPVCFFQICPATIFVGSWFLFPRQAYGAGEGPGNRGEAHRVWLIRLIQAAQREEGSGKSRASLDSAPSTPRSVYSSLRLPLLAPETSVPQPPELYNVGFWLQLRSLPFLGITVALSFFILLVNFNVATVSDQVLQEALAGGMSATDAQAVAAHYTSLFTLLMPLVGAGSIPLVALVLVKLGLAPAFAAIGVLDLIFSLTTLPQAVPLEWKVVGYVAMGCARPLMYSAFATFVADVFGFSNFGKLYGLAQLGGLLVAPLNYGLAAGTMAYAGGQYLGADCLLLLLGLVVFTGFTVYLSMGVMSGFFIRPALPLAGGSKRVEVGDVMETSQ